MVNQNKEVPKKSSKTDSTTKEEGWFDRRKSTIFVTIGVVIIFIILIATWWYLASRISSLSKALQQSEQKLATIEKQLQDIADDQKNILSQVGQINILLAADLQSEIRSDKDIETKKAKSHQDYPQQQTDGSKITWILTFGLIIVILVIIYIVISKFRKQDY